jgi:boron transporter
MAQARHFPIKRPAGFHWDFFLLGIVTFVSGILGLPAPNGLVPQAPVHTESLSVMKQVDSKERFKSSDDEQTADERPPVYTVQRIRVVEQRVSHLVMGVSLGLAPGRGGEFT